MTGTIVVRTGVSTDLRTVDFEWVVCELRARVNDVNRVAMTSVLEPYDEHSADMLVADGLDTKGLRQFSDELANLVFALKSSHGQGGLVSFLEGLQAMIRADPRLEYQSQLPP